MGGKLGLRVAEGGRRVAVARDEAHVGLAKYVAKGDALRRTIGFKEEPAAVEGQIVGLVLGER